ncbi:MAG: permease-like cell division protein FtsX [Pseudomonadota bacterium]
MKRWYRQHAFAWRAAFGHFRKSPASFLFNVLVVAIALALPFAGLTVLENLRPMSAQLAVEPEISLFMAIDLPRDKALELAPAIRNLLQDDKKLAKVVFVPREQALESLNEKNGLSDVLTTLGGNPLPDGYVVKLDGFRDAADASRIDSIATALRSLPGVELVQLDSAWVKRLAALMSILRIALVLLASTLGVVVVAVAFNTIRLQVLTQLDEIEVSRLIGATDLFIHRPFYYTGATLGLCAGALALLGVALALQPLNGAIGELARLYGSSFQLVPLAAPTLALLLGMSSALGWFGAVLSVKRYLNRMA